MIYKKILITITSILLLNLHGRETLPEEAYLYPSASAAPYNYYPEGNYFPNPYFQHPMPFPGYYRTHTQHPLGYYPQPTYPHYVSHHAPIADSSLVFLDEDTPPLDLRLGWAFTQQGGDLGDSLHSLLAANERLLIFRATVKQHGYSFPIVKSAATLFKIGNIKDNPSCYLEKMK